MRIFPTGDQIPHAFGGLRVGQSTSGPVRFSAAVRDSCLGMASRKSSLVARPRNLDAFADLIAIGEEVERQDFGEPNAADRPRDRVAGCLTTSQAQPRSCPATFVTASRACTPRWTYHRQGDRIPARLAPQPGLLAFLKKVDAAVPGDLDCRVAQSVGRQPIRFVLHFTTTSSCSSTSSNVAFHTSARQLNSDFRAWIATWNDDPRPFVWTKTADHMLAIIGNYCAKPDSVRR
jgi:hypothetical protein